MTIALLKWFVKSVHQRIQKVVFRHFVSKGVLLQ